MYNNNILSESLHLPFKSSAATAASQSNNSFTSLPAGTNITVAFICSLNL